MSTRTGNAWRTGKVVAVLACVLVCVLAVAACAPRLQPPGPGAPAPDLTFSRSRTHWWLTSFPPDILST